MALHFFGQSSQGTLPHLVNAAAITHENAVLFRAEARESGPPVSIPNTQQHGYPDSISIARIDKRPAIRTPSIINFCNRFMTIIRRGRFASTRIATRENPCDFDVVDDYQLDCQI
jgi:hypothetical protein